MADEPEPGWWRLAGWSVRAHGAFVPQSVLVLVLLVGATSSPDRADPSVMAYHEAT